MTKSDLHDLVDRLPENAVEGAGALLAEIAAGRIDPEQAGFWTREWRDGEREADAELAAGEGTVYESSEAFAAHLKPSRGRYSLPGCKGDSGLVRPPLSHPVGLTRPVEMPASVDAEAERSKGEVPAI